MSRRRRRGILLQMSSENKEFSTDPGLMGEAKIPAEHQNIAIHRAIKEDVPRENPHTAAAVSFHRYGA